jgi:hypothetical protein
VVRVEESVKERTCHGYTIHNAARLWLWHVTAWVIVTTKDRHRVPDLIGGTERYVGVKVRLPFLVNRVAKVDAMVGVREGSRLARDRVRLRVWSESGNCAESLRASRGAILRRLTEER